MYTKSYLKGLEAIAHNQAVKGADSFFTINGIRNKFSPLFRTRDPQAAQLKQHYKKLRLEKNFARSVS